MTNRGAVADLSRYDDCLAWLRDRGENDPDVRAVYVGGSAATGGWDEWSDLDVDLLCRAGASDPTYDRLLARTRTDFAPDSVWELPPDTWPDGRQCFVNLQPRPGLLAEPTRIVDLHVTELHDPTWRVDVRRHGAPIVVHDPDGLLELAPDDEERMAASIAAEVEQIRQRRATAEWLVNRALARGHDAEAVSLYLRFGLGSLVRLLRVVHSPWRHDFGLRYLDDDLPRDVVTRLQALLPGDDLRTRSETCFAWVDQLLADRPAT